MSLIITGGRFKGRKLLTFSGKNTRPTTSMVRQALFNILQNQMQDASFLDLFAGSGIMGIEALSRGALKAVFVEQDKKTAAKLKENLEKLGLQSRGQVIMQDSFKALSFLKEPFDLAYVDPPYAFFQKPEKEIKKVEADPLFFVEKILAAFEKAETLKKDGQLFIEMPAEMQKPLFVFQNDRWELKDVRKYGFSLLTCFFIKV